MTRRYLSILGLTASTAALMGTSTVALAQEAPGPTLEEVVVTAQKRETNLQDTALAISAIGGETLAKRQIISLEGLAPSLPNVNFGRNVGIARIAIRGIGLDTTIAGQEGRVAYHLDGVYISRPTAALGSFFDVNRVEVVRGPQGTLYGRNATAGAVNVITSDPGDTLSGYARATVGNYELVSVEGAVGGALTETLSARLAIQTTDRDGYGKGFTTGTEVDDERTRAARVKLRFAPTDNFNVVLSADYRVEDDHNYVYHYIGAGKPGLITTGERLGGTLAADPRDTFEEAPTENDRTFYGFGAVATLDLDWAQITSVTGYRNSSTDYRSDVDGTQVVVARLDLLEDAEQFSEELRLNGEAGNLNWLVGGYYFTEKTHGVTNFSPISRATVGGPQTLAQGLYLGGTYDTDAYALFGQLDYEILPRLTLSGGLRYSYEKKSLDQANSGLDLARPYNPASPPVLVQFQDAATSFDDLTPRVGLEYRVTGDTLLYVTWSQGFKSGGFALGSFAAPVEPETLTDYEGGVKTTWLDGRLRTNLAAFYYDYKNLQVQKIIGAVLVPVNAAAAEVKGVEAEIGFRPIDRLEITANAAWLDATYTDFTTSDPARAELGELDLSGNQLSQAPSYTANLAAEYTAPMDAGDLAFRVEGNWVDKVYFSPFARAEISQPSNAKFNALVSFKSATSGMTAAAYVRNISDERTVASSQVSNGLWGFPILGAFDPPRTYGLTLGYSF